MNQKFWTRDWFAAVAFTFVFAVLAFGVFADGFESLERYTYDIGVRARERTPSDRIAIIAIDDQSIANIGRWPWPRDVHAQLIDQLAAAKAKTIVQTVFFFEPQTDRGLEHIRKIKQALAQSGDNAGAQEAGRLIADAELALARQLLQVTPPPPEAAADVTITAAQLKALNATPQSPNPDNTVTEPLALDDVETKFQISFKTKLWQDVLGKKVDLWVAYTQISFWQFYDFENSAPFREDPVAHQVCSK